MANELVPFFEPGVDPTGQATAAVTGCRFLIASADKLSGPGIPQTPQVGASDPTDGGNYMVAHAAANGPSIGVSKWDAAIGEKVGIINRGIVPMVADGNIAVGQQVMVGANGKPKAYAAPALSGNAENLAVVVVVGICMTGVLNGAIAEILLTI
jgi:hypothetical protein